MRSTGIPIPGEDKLVRGAAQKMLELSDFPGLDIHLHKQIPMGGGLGGGSSDAAFTLRLLNEVFRTDLPASRLESLALTLGSDCPFFIEDGWRFGSGRGEVLTPFIPPTPKIFAVLVNPGIHLSTAAAFSKIDPRPAPEGWKKAIEEDFFSGIELLRNDFEPYAFKEYPVLNEIKGTLTDKGAFYAAMSGSGSTMFGLFREEVLSTDLPFGDQLISASFLN